MGIPYFTSFDGMIEPEAVRAVPEAMARKCLACLFSVRRIRSPWNVQSSGYQRHRRDRLSYGNARGLGHDHALHLFDSIQRAYGGSMDLTEPAAETMAPPPAAITETPEQKFRS